MFYVLECVADVGGGKMSLMWERIESVLCPVESVVVMYCGCGSL